MVATGPQLTRKEWQWVMVKHQSHEGRTQLMCNTCDSWTPFALHLAYCSTSVPSLAEAVQQQCLTDCLCCLPGVPCKKANSTLCIVLNHETFITAGSVWKRQAPQLLCVGEAHVRNSLSWQWSELQTECFYTFIFIRNCGQLICLCSKHWKSTLLAVFRKLLLKRIDFP